MYDKWDVKTANTCQINKLLPKFCNNCRDKDYCHKHKNKQISMFEYIKGVQYVRQLNDELNS